jgi:hypothetical protein
MNPMSGFGDGVNLFTIIINVLFGFFGGLILFIGAPEVIAYGTSLAQHLLKVSGYGQQMAQFGFATTAAPYVVLAPIGGIAVKQLTAVRSIKSFLFFAGAVLVGVALAYFTQGYFVTLIKP